MDLTNTDARVILSLKQSNNNYNQINTFADALWFFLNS